MKARSHVQGWHWKNWRVWRGSGRRGFKIHRFRLRFEWTLPIILPNKIEKGHHDTATNRRYGFALVRNLDCNCHGAQDISGHKWFCYSRGSEVVAWVAGGEHYLSVAFRAALEFPDVDCPQARAENVL